MTRSRLPFAVALGVTIALAMSGCTVDGNQAARDEAARIMTTTANSVDPPIPHPRDADYLAAQFLDAAPATTPESAERTTTEVLGWSGKSGDPHGATVRVRITVQLDAANATAIGQPDRTAGTATRCWKLTFFGTRNYDTLRTAEIPCSDSRAKTPHPTPPAPDPPTGG